MIISGASVIELRAISPQAGQGAITLAVAPATLTLLRGEPGCRPRQLARIIGLAEPPAAGTVLVEGEDAASWTDERRAEYRARRVAFLFGTPFLLPALTVIENVAMPIFKRGGAITAEDAGQRARALLAWVGLTGSEETAAGTLPLIEQYGVALARALANEPALLVVEELDVSLTGEALQTVAAWLRRAALEKGVAVVATVSPVFTPAASDRIFDCAPREMDS